MAILTEELGELARHFARQFGDQSYRVSENILLSKEDRRGLITDEMADPYERSENLFRRQYRKKTNG